LNTQLPRFVSWKPDPESEFIAHNKNTDEVCQAIGADKLIYQNLDDLLWCVQQGNANITEFDCKIASECSCSLVA
jgi:glutamine phosphoribosylpyrophosphate amidotransferase